jgi:hypothetical protein
VWKNLIYVEAKRKQEAAKAQQEVDHINLAKVEQEALAKNGLARS